jgi:hypothetical protein
MPDFSFATAQVNAAGAGREVMFYDVTGSVVTQSGTPIALPTITQVNSMIIRCSKHDPNIFYVGGQNYGAGDSARAVLYRIDRVAGTATLLGTFGLDTTNSALITDIVTLHDSETAYFSVGNESDIGIDWNRWGYGDTPDGGVWKTTAGAAPVFLGRGRQYPYHSYNSNVVSGICSIALGEFDSHIYTLHAPTENVGVFSCCVSKSADDGVTWTDIPNTGGVGGTSLCNLGSIQYHTEVAAPFIWYGNDDSGTGTFSFPNSQRTYSIDATSDTRTNLAVNIATGTVGGLFYLASGAGVLFQMEQSGCRAYVTVNNGVTWALAHSSGTKTMHAKGYEVHRFQEWAIAVTEQGGGSPSGSVHWTLDGGSSWQDAVLGAQRPGSVAFIYDVPVPPPPAVAYRQLLTWRDARGFTGSTVFYVAAPDLDTARAAAFQIQEALRTISNASMQAALGANTEPPTSVVYGAADTAFQDIEDLAYFEFITELAGTGGFYLPAPYRSLFLSDVLTLDRDQELVSTIAATCLANGLCNRGGVPYAAFQGGHYERSSTRGRQSIFTQNPGLSGPGL